MNMEKTATTSGNVVWHHATVTRAVLGVEQEVRGYCGATVPSCREAGRMARRGAFIGSAESASALPDWAYGRFMNCPYIAAWMMRSDFSVAPRLSATNPPHCCRIAARAAGSLNRCCASAIN